MDVTFKVDVFALAAAALAASRETSRPALCGVHVKRDTGGTTYSATDAHCALIIRDLGAKGEPAEVLVPVELCRKPLKTAPWRTFLQVSEKVLTLVNSAGGVIAAASAMPEGVTFPGLERVIPPRASDKAKRQGHISPITSGQVWKATQILAGGKAGLPIFLPSGDERDPFIGLFDVGEGREGFAIVMPVVGAVREWVRPEWA